MTHIQSFPRFLYHVLVGVFLSVLAACTAHHQPDAKSGVQPRIYPDYTSVTIPCNIAPLNFRIELRAQRYQTEVGIVGKKPLIEIVSDKPVVQIDEKDWHDLLRDGAGKQMYMRISTYEEGCWTVHGDILNTISQDSIDRYLVYRLIYPGYELWKEMGIYQRNLTTFEQTPVLENKDFNRQCVNCHSFSSHTADRMMVHVRGKQGGTLIYHDGKVEKVQPKPVDFKNGATYPAWHPHHPLIAFSSNEIQQFFHSSGKKPIEVSDLSADLFFYDVETHEAFTDSLVCGSAYYETFPAWSPQGTALYFCRAKAPVDKLALDSIRYDLCRLSYDANSRRISEIQTVFPASEQGKSVSFPVVSPDGKYVMFTLSDYGNFSIWHPESDLWLLSLQTGEARPMDEVNSKDVDSWHCWSSNSAWFTFSSKRLNGGWAHPYIAWFDRKSGKAGKPFLLPQRDPCFYDTFTFSFNRPELIRNEITIQRQLLNGIGGE